MTVHVPRHPGFGWAGLALLAFLSADLTGALLERQLPPAPPHPARLAAAAGSEQHPFPTEELQTLLRRAEPTGPSERPKAPDASDELASKQPATNPTRTQSAPPHFLGTMEGQGGPLALLQQGDETRVLAPGEEWQGWSVVEVTTYATRLRGANGKDVELHLSLGQPAPTAEAAVPTAPAEAAIVPLTSQKEVRELLKHPGDWLPSVHAQPITREDAAYGVRLKFANLENPFARLGLHSGDIGLSLNGHPIHGMEDINWVSRELGNNRSLSFELDRNGEHVGLQVELDE